MLLLAESGFSGSAAVSSCSKEHSEAVLLLIVAERLRERGRIGELTAEIYSSQPGRAEKLKDVVLSLAGLKRPVQVEHLWYHNGRPVFKFHGIDSISDAQMSGRSMIMECAKVSRKLFANESFPRRNS